MALTCVSPDTRILASYLVCCCSCFFCCDLLPVAYGLWPSSPDLELAARSWKLAAAFHVCDGKIPNSDKIKLITKNGIMLSCGCEPPEEPIAPGSMFMLGAVFS